MRLLRQLLLALCLASVSGAGPNVTEPFLSQCAATWFWLPTLNAPPSTIAAGTTTDSATDGRAGCARFHAFCSGTITALGMRVVTIIASNQFDGAIYSSDGTTLITHLGARDYGTTGKHFVTGLSGTITAGTDYLWCWAASEHTTGRLAGLASTVDAVIGTSSASTSAFTTGAAAAGNLAQFNANCTANVTPYACCTGVGTGTCTGFTNGLGTLGNGLTNANVMVGGVVFQ